MRQRHHALMIEIHPRDSQVVNHRIMIIDRHKALHSKVQPECQRNDKNQRLHRFLYNLKSIPVLNENQVPQRQSSIQGVTEIQEPAVANTQEKQSKANSISP